ncbi:MAG: toll/interleukin-1 receptor domain-containing protein, partial [Oscillospiraceae bacterium]
TLITQDADYLEALSHADVLQKEVYQREAEYIANVQKGILEISNKEEPFDVFICYKETGEDGKRTQDSVLAQDLYYQLTQEGFKVFFSRITLEDKLGSAYEPYIFAALNSSKVMVVVGTKPEYFNAVWVKNEWSRYLLLMKEDRTKMLIPAYKDMDPYDLPEALSMFQAQDMSKLGFMQDLIRGIKKIAGSGSDNALQSSNTVSSANSKADNLVKRGFMSLEDGDMQKAGSYFEQALNEDAEEARAYVGLLLVELDLRSEADLETVSEPLDTRNNFKKAIRFADDKLRERLSGYNEAIRNREFDSAYNKAKAQLENAHSFDDVKAGVNSLLQVKGRGGANDILFNTACKYSEDTDLERLNLALQIFKEIPDHPGAEDVIYKMGTRFENETDTEKLNFCVSALEIISDRDEVAEKITGIKAIIIDIETRTAEKKKRDHDEKINKWRSDFVDGLVELDLESYATDISDCIRYKRNYKEGKRLIAASGYDHDHYFENKVGDILNDIMAVIDEENRKLEEKRGHFAFAVGCSLVLSLIFILAALLLTSKVQFCILAGIALCMVIVFLLIRNRCTVDIKGFLSYMKYINAWKEFKKTIENEAFRDSELKELYEIRKSQRSDVNRADGSSGSQEKNPAKRKKSLGAVGVVIIIICVIVGIVGGVLFFTQFLPSKKYDDAIVLMNNGSYEEAIALFSELGKYKDSRSLIAQCHQYIANEETPKEENQDW